MDFRAGFSPSHVITDTTRPGQTWRLWPWEMWKDILPIWNVYDVSITSCFTEPHTSIFFIGSPSSPAILSRKWRAVSEEKRVEINYWQFTEDKVILLSCRLHHSRYTEFNVLSYKKWEIMQALLSEQLTLVLVQISISDDRILLIPPKEIRTTLWTEISIIAVNHQYWFDNEN